MPMDVVTHTLYTYIQYTCTVSIVQIDQTKGCLLLSKTFLNSRAPSAYRLPISFAHFTSTNDIQVRNKHICRLNQRSLSSRLILLKRQDGASSQIHPVAWAFSIYGSMICCLIPFKWNFEKNHSQSEHWCLHLWLGISKKMQENTQGVKLIKI